MWLVCTSTFCGGSCFPGSRSGGMQASVGVGVGGDSPGCWTNLMSYVFLSESSSLRPCLLGLSLSRLSIASFLHILLSSESALSPPLEFLLVALAPPCASCPTMLPALPCRLPVFRSPVRSPGARSRTRVQLRLRGGQLLSRHWRPSHRPGTEALSDLDMWAAQARALLHRQPPPGEGGEPGSRLCGCLLQPRPKGQTPGTPHPAGCPDRKRGQPGSPGIRLVAHPFAPSGFAQLHPATFPAADGVVWKGRAADRPGPRPAPFPDPGLPKALPCFSLISSLEMSGKGGLSSSLYTE